MSWSVEFRANIPINQQHLIDSIDELPADYILSGVNIEQVGTMGVKLTGEIGVNGKIARDYCKTFKRILGNRGYKFSSNKWLS